MKSDEVIIKIKDIIFSEPEEMYKHEEPENCFEGEWEEASNEEKAFLLVKELLLNLNREQIKNKPDIDESSIVIKLEKMPRVIKLEKMPRFYSHPDENMFFNAMNTVPAITDIKGSGRALYLYCSRAMTIDERKFLTGLFNRYQIPIPAVIQV